MKTIKYFKLIAIALIAILSACKKNPLSQLPLITQTGQDTFGCLINGQVNVYHDDWTFENGNSFIINDVTNFLGIGIKDNSVKPTISLVIDSLNVLEGTTYKLSNNKLRGYAFGSVQYPSSSYFSTNNTVVGSLTIIKHSQAIVNGYKRMVIAGTFNFNAVNEKGDTIKVTNGRFDLPY